MNPAVTVQVGQALPPPQPGQQQVYVYPQQQNSSVKENYNARTSRIFGIIHITGGVFSIVGQGVLIGIGSQAGYSGAGIWCGILFLLAGSFGYTAGKYKTRCMIVTYMVHCIIACVFTPGIIISSSIGLGLDKDQMQYDFTDYHEEIEHGYTYNYAKFNRVYSVAMTFNALMVMTGILEFITLIWGSALACKVMCCCKDSPQGMVMLPVQYINGQAVVVTSGQAGQPAGPSVVQQGYVGPPGYPGPATAPSAPLPPVPQRPMEEKPAPPHTPPPSYSEGDMAPVHY